MIVANMCIIELQSSIVQIGKFINKSRVSFLTKNPHIMMIMNKVSNSEIPDRPLRQKIKKSLGNVIELNYNGFCELVGQD